MDRPSSHIGIIHQFRGRSRGMPLPSRYLRSSQQISRLLKLPDKENGPRLRRYDGRGDDYAAASTDHGGPGTSTPGRRTCLDLAALRRNPVEERAAVRDPVMPPAKAGGRP